MVLLQLAKFWGSMKGMWFLSIWSLWSGDSVQENGEEFKQNEWVWTLKYTQIGTPDALQPWSQEGPQIFATKHVSKPDDHHGRSLSNMESLNIQRTCLRMELACDLWCNVRCRQNLEPGASAWNEAPNSMVASTHGKLWDIRWLQLSCFSRRRTLWSVGLTSHTSEPMHASNAGIAFSKSFCIEVDRTTRPTPIGQISRFSLVWPFCRLDGCRFSHFWIFSELHLHKTMAATMPFPDLGRSRFAFPFKMCQSLCRFTMQNAQTPS